MYRCPDCKSKRVYVRGETWGILLQGHAGHEPKNAHVTAAFDMDDGILEWDHGSPMKCQHCRYEGTGRDFSTE